MKRLLLYTGLILTVGIGLAGCYKDIIKPDLPKDPNAPPQQVSFKNELTPLFNANCTDVGCHVSGWHHPYMTAGCVLPGNCKWWFCKYSFTKRKYSV